MTPDSVMTVFQQALEVILVLVLIILIPALVVGLLVSMFQAATQINEMTLSFIPKLLITLATLMAAGPFMLNMMVEYTSKLIRDIPYLIG
ncbi:MAG: flagellar biosynthesis protein FliQ [Thioalkalispiraceae bacterium]|jgi:flagellar biosynthetic protein FliQ